jgi:hypothetical protein
MVLEKIKIGKGDLKMYLQSRHPYELEVKGVLLPKKEYTDREMQSGKRNIVQIKEEQLELLKTDKVFSTLLQNGQYVIMENVPTQYLNMVDKLKITEENYIKIINEKDKQIEALGQEIEALKKEILNIKTVVIPSENDDKLIVTEEEELEMNATEPRTITKVKRAVKKGSK